MDVRASPIASATPPAKTRTTRVFVVEDSELIRGRLLSMLAGMSGVEVVGHAETAADAITGVLAARPDVVVLDIKLKAGSGIEVLRTIKRRMPEAAVIVHGEVRPELQRAAEAVLSTSQMAKYV